MTKFGVRQAARLLPVRKNKSSKRSGGNVLVIAGSPGMYGAAVLTSTAALRSGAGYVTLRTDAKNFPTVKYPDFLILDKKRKKMDLQKFNAVAVGPGLGVSPLSKKIIKKLISQKIKSVVMDADALNSCARYGIKKFPPTWILTPHEGELARLLKVSDKKIKAQREFYVQKAQKKFRVTVLLKGHRTLVASDGKLSEIQSGNASLAKAGTGDVLTGIISAFLAQGLGSHDAACTGAFVHGFIADSWIKNNNDILSLLASDLLAQLPIALKKIRSTSSD